MPLFQLINDLFRALQERRRVKRTAAMANFLLDKASAAYVTCGGLCNVHLESQRLRVKSA
jgi:hypothetical protein